jgi:hypothetical protein
MQFRFLTALLGFALAAQGCAPPTDASDPVSEIPASSLADAATAKDLSDLGNCAIVLRTLTPPDLTKAPPANTEFAWTGTLDVSQDVLAKRAPEVHVEWTVGAKKADKQVTQQVSGAPIGFQRFTFTIDSNTLATTDVAARNAFRMTVTPYLKANGRRLLDNNRTRAAGVSYVLWSGITGKGIVPPRSPRLGAKWTVAAANAICPANSAAVVTDPTAPMCPRAVELKHVVLSDVQDTLRGIREGIPPGYDVGEPTQEALVLQRTLAGLSRSIRLKGANRTGRCLLTWDGPAIVLDFIEMTSDPDFGLAGQGRVALHPWDPTLSHSVLWGNVSVQSGQPTVQSLTASIQVPFVRFQQYGPKPAWVHVGTIRTVTLIK